MKRHGGQNMNVAFARNEYANAKSNALSSKSENFEAVSLALRHLLDSMIALKDAESPEEREPLFEKSLTSIYFLQKCLDFEKGGELARNLFKVYEYCRVQILQDSSQEIYIHGLTNAIEFIKTISEGCNGIRSKI